MPFIFLVQKLRFLTGILLCLYKHNGDKDTKLYIRFYACFMAWKDG